MFGRNDQMKKIKIIKLFILIFMLCLFISSCLQTEPSITDQTKLPETVLYTSEELKYGVFRGGSLLSSDDPSLNQLIEGMEIPFCLNSIPSAARRSRSEYETVIQYGYILIKTIRKDTEGTVSQIEIEYLLYNSDGTVQHYNSSVVLGTSLFDRKEVDFNGDGVTDMSLKGFMAAYDTEQAASREVLNQSVVLDFSDSRENGNGCTFRLLEKNYTDETYPSGILAVNPNGNLVTTSQGYDLYEAYTPLATSVSFYKEGLPILNKGDFIIDRQSERFRKITAVHDFSDHTVFESTDTTIDEAFILFDLEYSEPLQVTIDRETMKPRLSYDYEFDKVIWEKATTTEHGTFTQTLEATGNVYVDVELHASFHAGIKWHWWPPHPSIELSCDVGIDFNFDHHFFLDYKAVEEYAREWKKVLFDETETIVVEGVPINFRGAGTVGLKIDGTVEAELWAGYRLHGGLSAGVGYKLGDGFHKNFSHSLGFSRYGPEMKLKGTLNIKPYFDLKLALGIAYVAWVESDTIPYALGVIDGNAGVYMDEDYKITPEDMWIDFNLYGGIEQDITLRLGYKWFSISKTFELYNGKWPIWDIEFKWPQAPVDFRMTPYYRRAVFDWIDKSKVETGYKVYDKPYGSSSYETEAVLPANTQAYTYNGNKDALFELKAYYHVKHLDFDLYQILAPEKIQLIACPENFTGTPVNGNPVLKWDDISQMNTETELYIKKENDPEYTMIATVTGDADTGNYTMPENVDSQFKARAVYVNSSDTDYSAYSNVYQWLAIPSGMTGFPYGDGEILLTWRNNSHKSQGYDLWMQEYDQPASVTLIHDPATKSYIVHRIDDIDWDLKDAQFKIRNYIFDTTLATDTYSGWSNIFQWLAAPSDFNMEQVFNNTILTWTDNSHVESGYEIWKEIDGQTIYKTGECAEDSEKYLDKPETQYLNDEFAYKIRAYKNEGETTGYSDWSSKIIYNFRAPDNLRIEAIASVDYLRWDNQSKFQTGVSIYRRSGTDSFTHYLDLNGVNITEYQLNEAEKGYDYFIRGYYKYKTTEQYTQNSNIVLYP